MSLDTFATIRGTAEQLSEMVRVAAAGYHDDVYMRVVGSEDTVHFVTESNGRQVMSYCTFSDLKLVEGDAEAIIPTGLDSDTKGYLDYLSMAGGSDTTEIRLLGEEPDDADAEDHPYLASYWEAEGALSARVRLPGSEEDLSSVPWGLPDRWTSNDEYLSAKALDENGEIDVGEVAEYVPPTVIETTSGTINESIIDPAEFMDDVNYYPVVVEDGEFRLFLEGQAGDDRIEGEVSAESVKGPDVDRTFDEGFGELFGVLSGVVNLSTAPEPSDPDAPSPPLVVTQTNRSGRTVRHILGAFTED